MSFKVKYLSWVLLLGFLSCNVNRDSYRMKDYFPLKLGAVAYYHRWYPSLLPEIKPKDDTVVVEGAKVGEKFALYFAENIINTPRDYGMRPNPFGTGAMYYSRKGLYIVHIIMVKQELKLKKEKHFQLIFPRRVKKGYKKAIEDQNGRQYTYDVVGKSDVQIGNRKYENCLLIQTITNWPKYLDWPDTGYVWLKKNIGVVRWERKGKTDEIIEK